jgi:hypothetical protein
MQFPGENDPTSDGSARKKRGTGPEYRDAHAFGVGWNRRRSGRFCGSGGGEGNLSKRNYTCNQPNSQQVFRQLDDWETPRGTTHKIRVK